MSWNGSESGYKVDHFLTTLHQKTLHTCFRTHVRTLPKPHLLIQFKLWRGWKFSEAGALRQPWPSIKLAASICWDMCAKDSVSETSSRFSCSPFRSRFTVRVKITTGSLVTLENLLPQNYRYRYRLDIRMNSLNYHYRYRPGVRSHTFISIDSQLQSWKSFGLISQKLIQIIVTVLNFFWIRKVQISNMTVQQLCPNLSAPRLLAIAVAISFAVTEGASNS